MVERWHPSCNDAGDGRTGVLKVLIIEEGWGATLHLAHALAELGLDVSVATANGRNARYRHRNVDWWSLPRSDSPDYLSALDRIVADRNFDRVLPLTEALMWRTWDAWRGADRLFPVLDSVQRALLRNKHRLVEHMGARGIPVPRQVPLTAARDLGLPVVVKGASGAGGARVEIVDTDDARERAVRRASRCGGEWVAQEWLPGPTFLVGGLCHEGRALRIYAAEKLEQYPPRTGPAIRLRSTRADELVDAALRVFAELRLTGLASADFMRRPDGTYVLLEVNPRPWGSIAGAQSAGVDLFTPYAALLAGRVPAPDLAFVENDECRIFPRYLMSARYRSFGGAMRVLVDLLGNQGRGWRDPRFALRNAARMFSLRDQWQPF